METLRARFERVLAEGPGTGREVAIELGMDPSKVARYLQMLHKAGHLRRWKVSPAREPGWTGRKRVWCYALPE